MGENTAGSLQLALKTLHQAL